MRRREETGVWWASPHAAAFVAILPAVLAAFLIIHEMTLHLVLGGVTFPSGGTNFASSLALSNGQLPYNNFPQSFPLTQPPGMSIILLPFAWAAHGGDASGAMAAARIVTALVAIANVFFVGLTARRHGPASTFIAGVLFAVYPWAFYSTASYTFEPWLVLFCLLAYTAAFSQGQMVHGGRLVWAGALVGFAIAIKPWALIPAAVLLICAAVNWREALLRMFGGIVIGVGVPCIFFFLASPGQFWHDVVNAELSAGGNGSAASSSRLAEILGLGAPIGYNGSSTGNLPLLIGLIMGALIVFAALAKASTSTIQDWAVFGTVAGLATIAFLPSSLPFGYTYFLAAFGAVLLGNTMGTILSIISTVSVGSGDVSSTVAGGVTLVLVAGMIGVIAIAAPKEADYQRTYFMNTSTNPSPAIDQYVPAGACVISNNPEAIVISGRFAQLPSGCPLFVDPGGIERAANSTSPDNPAVIAAWERAFGYSKFFVLAPSGSPVPWSPALRNYFSRNFVLVHTDSYKIYENKSPLL